nr:hotdog fold thioesterase [Actinomycetales bacterium]
MTHTNERDHAAQATARQGALGERMGIEFLELLPGFARARMPVEGNTQPVGLLHGGASVVLAETLGSFAASLDAHPLVAVGTEVSATHHRAVRAGYVTATCTPLHVGRSMATYHIEIVDDGGARTCTARLTCALRPAPAGAAGLFAD